jgi:hypothetical protein
MAYVPQIRIMISSTRADLMQYREEASRVIKRVAGDFERKAQLVEISMEKEVQIGEREFAVAVSKRWVEESDWILLVVGWNYGTVSTEPDAKGLSVTEWEYRRAVELSKKTFVFVAGEPKAENQYCVADGEEDLRCWNDRQDPATRDKLKCFRDALASTHLEYFRNLRHFSERLEKTLRAAIPDPASLPTGLLIDVRPWIQQCIDKVKVIAACKRVHDHLHELRQNVVRPILESALVQWRGDGELKVPVAALIAHKIGFAEGLNRDIATERQFLDVKADLLAALARVEGMSPQFDLQEQPPQPDDFGRKVGRFAAAVQTAFTLSDAAMLKDSNLLDNLHVELLTNIAKAMERRRLSAAEEAKLNEGLQNVAINKKRLTGELDAHHDWQYQHDKLDMLNGFRRSEDFRDQLDNYLDNDAPQLRSMVEREAAAQAQSDADPIFAGTVALLDKNLAAVSQAPALPAFDNTRKTFDDVFYQIDKRTLATVEASEQRVRALESRLEEMAQQQSEAT